jgi:hemerythrin-like domain-containing protein
MQHVQSMEPDEETFEPKMIVLIEEVRRHVEQEESDLFPKFREALSRKQLQELGQRIEEGKKAMMSPKDYLKKS